MLISVVTGFGVSSLILSRIGWPQPGFFASTTDDAVRRDEHGRVAAAALQHVEVVLDLVDVDDLRSLRRLPRLDGRQDAGRQQQAEHECSPHEIPPGKNTRWMNQNAPAAITTTDPANASRRAADFAAARSAARARCHQ